MGPNNKSTLGLIALFSAIAAVAPGPPPLMEMRLRKAGFQHIGNFTPTEAGEVSALGATIQADETLWLSPNALSQPEALRACWGQAGRLVSILNVVQHDQVRVALSSVPYTTRIWTSGTWDGVQRNWYWTSNKPPLLAYYKNFAPYCENPYTGQGILFVPGGTGSWCSDYTFYAYRFLCSIPS